MPAEGSSTPALRRVRLAGAVALALALLGAAGPAPAEGRVAVDLELVLAVDASSSVDDAEYRLQMEGIAAGFRDAQVQGAIRSGPLGRIAAAILVWGEAAMPKDPSEWMLIEGAADAERFAQMAESFPRRVRGGTGIGAGVAAAVRMINGNGFRGTRRTIDVSGDGRETPPRTFVVLVPQARAMAHAFGVTINGLAVLTDVPELDDWYRRNVITGPGAFVIAADYEDFARAMRIKLLREIEAEKAVSMAAPAAE